MASGKSTKKSPSDNNQVHRTAANKARRTKKAEADRKWHRENPPKVARGTARAYYRGKGAVAPAEATE